MAGSARSSTPTFILSAGIVLCRDAPGLEVLLMQRSAAARVGPGALVFPGGKLEPEDEDSLWADAVTGACALSHRGRLRRICALRETFEETGLLIAQTRYGEPASDQTLDDLRKAMMSGRCSLAAALLEVGLRLDLGGLVPFSHWITPITIQHRFNTIFYINAAPTGQIACADGREMTRAIWASPQSILESEASGQNRLMFPTRFDLERLRDKTSCTQALSYAQLNSPMPIQPKIVVQNGRAVYKPEPAQAYYFEEEVAFL